LAPAWPPMLLSSNFQGIDCKSKIDIFQVKLPISIVEMEEMRLHMYYHYYVYSKFVSVFKLLNIVYTVFTALFAIRTYLLPCSLF
jgi:hypothetical protein